MGTYTMAEFRIRVNAARGPRWHILGINLLVLFCMHTIAGVQYQCILYPAAMTAVDIDMHAFQFSEK